MQEYVANPVVVKAAKITDVYTLSDGAAHVFLDGESGQFYASAPMCARMSPKIGDYWVIQEDGYAYLNPKDVFERKYRKA
jgi:hypothetical protein